MEKVRIGLRLRAGRDAITEARRRTVRDDNSSRPSILLPCFFTTAERPRIIAVRPQHELLRLSSNAFSRASAGRAARPCSNQRAASAGPARRPPSACVSDSCKRIPHRFRGGEQRQRRQRRAVRADLLQLGGVRCAPPDACDKVAMNGREHRAARGGCRRACRCLAPWPYRRRLP